MTITTPLARLLGALALSAVVLASSASCSSEKKTENAKSTPPAAQRAGGNASTGTRTIDVTPGEAGGVVQETFTASATVQAVDPAHRRITLKGDGGNTATFTAPPEMRNFDQLRPGDRVKATVVSRLTVIVDEDQGPADDAYAATVARTPKGAKPGVLVAESYEIVGTIKLIDPVARRATIEFADGQTKTIPVRPDVDLTRYQPDDRVIIRVTQALRVIAEAP